MKILVISDIFPSRSAPVSGVFVKEQADSLRAENEVRVLVIERRFVRILSSEFASCLFGPDRGAVRPDKGDDPGVLRFSYPVLTLFGTPWYRFESDRAYAAAKAVLAGDGFKPDLAFAFKSFPAGYVAMRLKRDFGIPAVTMEFMSHFSDYFDEPHRGKRVIEAVNGVDKTIHTKFQISEMTAQGLPREKLGFGAFGIDTVKFKPAPEAVARRERVLRDKDFKLLVIGRIEKMKGLEILFKAVSRLKSDFPSMSLTVVGPIEAGGDEILARIPAMGLAETVLYPGICPNDELPALINAHDILVSPSLFETQGLTMLEAFACGKPSVATRCGGPEETVVPGAGVLVEKNNPEDLARGLREAMEGYARFDPAWIRSYAVENFSYDVTNRRLKEVFAEARGER